MVSSLPGEHRTMMNGIFHAIPCRATLATTCSIRQVGSHHPPITDPKCLSLVELFFCLKLFENVNLLLQSQPFEKQLPFATVGMMTLPGPLQPNGRLSNIPDLVCPRITQGVYKKPSHFTKTPSEKKDGSTNPSGVQRASSNLRTRSRSSISTQNCTSSTQRFESSRTRSPICPQLFTEKRLPRNHNVLNDCGFKNAYSPASCSLYSGILHPLLMIQE